MKQSVGILFGLILLTGCGSIKMRSVDAGEVKAVKRVAIASFTFTQPHAASVSLGGGRGGANSDDLMSHQSEEVSQTYKDIGIALATRMKWSVATLEQVRENAAYRQVFEGKMKGWQNKAPVAGKNFVVPEIMDAQSVRRMKTEEKDALMLALGVDAIMETQVNVRFATKGVAVMGIGSRYPQAHISFWLYKKGVEAPVWFDGHLEGDMSDKSVGKTGFFDENEVTRLGRLSARNAFQKLNPRAE